MCVKYNPDSKCMCETPPNKVLCLTTCSELLYVRRAGQCNSPCTICFFFIAGSIHCSSKIFSRCNAKVTNAKSDMRQSKRFTLETEILKAHLKQTNAQICPASVFVYDKECQVWDQGMIVIIWQFLWSFQVLKSSHVFSLLAVDIYTGNVYQSLSIRNW